MRGCLELRREQEGGDRLERKMNAKKRPRDNPWGHLREECPVVLARELSGQRQEPAWPV